jgi:hypothetical protein
MGSSVHCCHTREGKGGNVSEPCPTMTTYATLLLVFAPTPATAVLLAVDNAMPQIVALTQQLPTMQIVAVEEQLYEWRSVPSGIEAHHMYIIHPPTTQ